MKNRTLIPLALSIILSSCATTGRYASTSFEDAIYQQPGSGNYLVVNTNIDQELEALRGKTQKSNKIMIDGRVVEAAYTDENGNVEIDADSEKTYIILSPGESFEDRLSKFDNPTYTINVNYSNWESGWGIYNPWYSYMPYSPYRNSYWRHRWYSAWDPYMWGNWGNYYNRYGYDPYYSYYSGSWSIPYYNYYNNPWIYSNYGYQQGGILPHKYPGGDISGGRSRNHYYGKREITPMNNSTNRGAASSGSYIRRDVRTSQIRGASLNNNSTELNKRYSESIYRRDGIDSREGRTGNSITNNNPTQSSSSNRSGSTYERRNSSSTNRTQTSSGNINRTSTERVNRTSTGSVNRTSSGNINRTSTGSVNRTSSGNINRTSSGSVSRSSSVRNSNLGTTTSSQYRKPANSTIKRSSSNGSATRSSSFQRNSNTSTNSRTTGTYTVPTRSTSSSSSSSSSRSSTSSSSRSSTSSSSSGSSYRR